MIKKVDPVFGADQMSHVGVHDFCDSCQAGTVPVDTGNLVTINFIGEAFVGRFNRCGICGSVERYMFFFLGVPLLPLGKWRVKKARGGRFVARKIMSSSFPDLGRQHLQKRNRVLVPLLVILLLVLFVGVGAVVYFNPS